MGSSITPSFDLAQRRGAGTSSTAGWGASSVASSSAAASSSRPYTVLTQQPAGPQSGLFGVSHTYQIHPHQQPRSGMQTPVGGASLLSSAGTPAPPLVGSGGGAMTPSGGHSVLGATTPLLGAGGASSLQTPAGGGILTPLGGAASVASAAAAGAAAAGGASPFVAGGMASVSGVNTPLLTSASATAARPGVGADTPIGVTVSLNPNEMGPPQHQRRLRWAETHSCPRGPPLGSEFVCRARRGLDSGGHSAAAEASRRGGGACEGSRRADRPRT